MDCPSEATVVLLLQGRLGEEETQRVEEHADSCAACHALIGRLAQAELVDSPLEAPAPGPPTLEPSATVAPAGSSADLLRTGTRLGRYVVRRLVGVGGMGAVYAADDPELGRQVAIKLLHPGHLTGIEPEESRLRLLREGRALATLDHPNVIAVHDVGRFEESVFLAMDLVEGRTLRTWLRERPRSWREILRVFVTAGRGLAAAHAAGLVHRDFKPENVLIDADGRVRVTDFGLARARGRTAGDPSARSGALGASEAGSNATLTRAGTVLGTPRYMAPEQREGAPPDPRTDQYSYCLCLYEALWGSEAIRGAGAAGAPRPPPAGPTRRVPHWLRRALLPGLCASPTDRYPSMDALLAALQRDPWRRRRRWLMAGGVAAVVAGAALLPQLRTPESLCTGAERHLAEVWGPSSRRALRQAFLASDKPYAADAFRGVSTEIDAYARRWVGDHTEACAATRIRGEQSEGTMALRMQCLDSRRIALRAVVRELIRADAKMVERGLRIVGGLPDLAGCASMTVLAARQAEPTSLRARAELSKLRGELARASAWRAAGRLRETRPVLEKLATRAANLGYRPFEARVLLELGMLQASASAEKEAVRTLHRAATVAAAGRADRVIARAWTKLVYLEGVGLARRQEAERWAGYARAAIHRLGGDTLLEASLLVGLGQVESMFGLQDDARRHQERALALRQQRLGRDHLLVASAVNVLGITSARSGRFGEAATRFERVLAIREKALGPRHPDVSHILNNLANVRRLQGRLPEALRLHQRALAIREQALGKTAPMVAQSLGNMANVLNQLGRHEDAVSKQRRALRLWKRAYGPWHPEVAVAHGNLADALVRVGRPAEALTHRRRELAIYQRKLGPNHAEVGTVHDGIARILRRQGRFAAAVAHHRRAVAGYEKALRPGHPNLARALHHFGVTLAAQGRLGSARDRFQRALAIRRKALRPRHPELARTLGRLGELELRMGRLRRALALAEEALSILEQQRRPPAELGQARFLVARALWARGRRVEARRHAQGAARDLRRAGRRHAGRRRRVDRWLDRHLVASGAGRRSAR